MELYRTPGQGGKQCAAKTERSIQAAEAVLSRWGWSVGYRRKELLGQETGDHTWDWQGILDYKTGASPNAQPWTDAKRALDWALKPESSHILILHEHQARVGTAQILEYVIEYIRAKEHRIIGFSV